MTETNFLQHSPTGKHAEYLNQLVEESDEYETPEEVIERVLENDGSTTGIFRVDKKEISKLISHLVERVRAYDRQRRQIRYRVRPSDKFNKPKDVISSALGQRKELSDLSVEEANEVLDYLKE